MVQQQQVDWRSAVKAHKETEVRVDRFHPCSLKKVGSEAQALAKRIADEAVESALVCART